MNENLEIISSAEQNILRAEERLVARLPESELLIRALCDVLRNKQKPATPEELAAIAQTEELAFAETL